MSEIDKEIEQVADSLEKSSKTPRERLFDTIKQLGREGIKAKLPTLEKAEKELLMDALREMSKAVEMDSEYQAKFVQGKLKQTIIQEDKADDDQDEKLMKPEAAKFDHQGTPTPGWEGQVIKAKEPKMQKEESKEKPMEMEEKEHGVKDSKKLVEAEKKEHEKKDKKDKDMKKAEQLEKKMGVPKGVNPEKQERCVRKLKGQPGKNPYAICNAAMKKGESISAEVKAALVEIKKSVEEQLKEFGVEATPALIKSEMKRLLQEEDQLGDAPEMNESSSAKKEDVKALDLAEDSKDAQKKVNDEKQGQMKKAIWGDEQDLLKANTNGRNFHFSFEDHVKAVFDESQKKPSEEVKKSEGAKKEDLNDIIEKGQDTTWDDLQCESMIKSNRERIRGKIVKSFEDNEIAAALGLTPEEARKILGE